MPLLLGVFVLSGAVIGYEILLMRLFSISQWHHFAYMIISLALLGFGASGTLIALARSWLEARFTAAFAAAACLFGAFALAGFSLAQHIPFNPLEVMWDARQQLYLVQLYVLLALPFFCAATAIGLALTHHAGEIHLIYRYDLMGAGAGAVILIVGLFVLEPGTSLKIIGGAGPAAAALALTDRTWRDRPWLAPALLVIAVLGRALWPAAWIEPRLSPYKGLSQALRIPGTEVIEERSSPLGLITVVRSPTIPFRHVPGFSLKATAEPPPQLGVYTDGDSFTAITRYEGRRDQLAYLDYQAAALPYHIKLRPEVLILGAGGGGDILLALYHQASRIDAVELNPQMVGLVCERYADYAGHLCERGDTQIHIAEARGFLAAGDEPYDLIHVALLDSFNASAAGVYALHESNLYTIEAMGAYLGRLAPGGILAVTRWLKVPPRDSLKLFATALAALDAVGAARPDRHVALMRSWDTTTLLVKQSPFTDSEIATIREFAAARWFDVAYVPGIRADEANRYNVLDEAYLFTGAQALIGDQREAFLASYKFHIAPATDDRPYFFHFFKWRVLPELVTLAGRGGLPFIEWGYMILVATLVQAALVSIVLIILPLAALKARAKRSPPMAAARVVIYFLALGLAFLFIEMAFIQRFTLFLSHPLYAVAVVLAAFLVFAGLGSGFAKRLEAYCRRHPGMPAPIAAAVMIIVVLAALYILALPSLFEVLQAAPGPVKIAVTVLLIAPLAFAMGLPFPLGLRRLAAAAPEWVPWAWGINGCASVLSAALAVLLAIHFGFTAVIAGAATLYVIAAAASPPAAAG